MFTPPPSPQPARTSGPTVTPESLSQERQERFASAQASKRYIGRRFRMAVILIPVLVIFLTARLSYVASRVVEKTAEPVVPLSWHGREENSNWRHHKRHPEPQTQVSSPAASSPTSTSTSSAATPSPTATPPSAQPLPTIPSSPPAALPTPFLQPFDGGIAQNFSSLSCSNFFANMTNSAPFRQCRPFSLLLQGSNAFVDAQSNLTLMNAIIYGTCNTTPGISQCESNMAWFAGALKSACSSELGNNNALAASTLTALQAFSVMYDAACQADPTTNSYCYIEAIHNTNPSDLYYYALPLDITVPNSTVPTCSQCSKSVMGVYAASLKDANQKPLLTGLSQTYDPAAQLTVQYCGADFAQTSVVSAALVSFGRPPWIVAVAVGVISSLLMGLSS
ncbi:hypothetical protein BDN70DRAFT_224390 [Pholiota conissans]|uniref:DUF7729 domain-containing protein n=1 Tax=Pholiota conissans TaxID=109636 RepID=A0A9P6CQD7_9AGAR|nr:hypothetical protein BDN70DRAFT_224390 [Pholiota conissans]